MRTSHLCRPPAPGLVPVCLVPACLAALCLAAPAAEAQTYEQPSASTTVVRSNAVNVTRADDFVFTQSATVVRLRWSGTPLPYLDWEQFENFTIRFFADDAGQPGAVLATYAAGVTATFEYTNRLITRPAPWNDPGVEYDYTYSLPTPFVAQANVRYWISITNPEMDAWWVEPRWSWSLSASTQNPGAAVATPGPTTGPWTAETHNLAFALETRQPIVPIVECVAEHGNGTFTAYFGYDSTHAGPVIVGHGVDNAFAPLPADRGQVTWFGPGRSIAYPDSPFKIEFDGNPLQWTLLGTTVTASSATPRCPDATYTFRQPPTPDAPYDRWGGSNHYTVADDFVMPEATELRTIVFWGGDSYPQTYTGFLQQFSIYLHEDQGGHPGTVIASYENLLADFNMGLTRQATGGWLKPPSEYAPGVPEYRYVFPLPVPVTVQANVRYWLTVKPSQPVTWKGSTLSTSPGVWHPDNHPSSATWGENPFADLAFGLDGAPAVKPMLECYAWTNEGFYVGYFGYENAGLTPVTIPVGPLNWFNGPAADRGQPTTFLPGRSPLASALGLRLNDWELTWNLNGHAGMFNLGDWDFYETECPNNPVVFSQGNGLYGVVSDGVTNTIADDFQVAEDTQVIKIIWEGAYVTSAPPAAIDNFTIRIFDDASGQPGTVIAQYAAGASVVRTCEPWMYIDNVSHPACWYTFNLPAPLALTQNVRYWISIVNTPSYDTWRWKETSYLGDETAMSQSTSDPVVGPWSTIWGRSVSFLLERHPLH